MHCPPVISKLTARKFISDISDQYYDHYQLDFFHKVDEAALKQKKNAVTRYYPH